jgi:hypothetical protein
MDFELQEGGKAENPGAYSSKTGVNNAANAPVAQKTTI